MRLNFFFDVDGTLLPFGKGLPESALEAIRTVKGMGHRVFVSTGRSPAEMDPRLSVIPFDGGIFSAGGKVVVGDRELWSVHYSPEEKKEVMEYLKSKNLLYMLQSDSGTYLSQEANDFFEKAMFESIGGLIEIPSLVVTDDIPEEIEANKIIFLSPEGKGDEVRRDLRDKFDIVDNTDGIPQSMMAEICLKGISKGSGIEKLLEILGDDRKSSVGIGDGANDIEMIEYCGLGIAMGNAIPELKAKADWITSSVEEDGIKNALEYALEVYLEQNS